MTVVGVLAEADIGRYYALELGLTQSSHRSLNHPVGCGGLPPPGVLEGGKAEQQDRRARPTTRRCWTTCVRTTT